MQIPHYSFFIFINLSYSSTYFPFSFFLFPTQRRRNVFFLPLLFLFFLSMALKKEREVEESLFIDPSAYSADDVDDDDADDDADAEILTFHYRGKSSVISSNTIYSNEVHLSFRISLFVVRPLFICKNHLKCHAPHAKCIATNTTKTAYKFIICIITAFFSNLTHFYDGLVKN